jgi:hypothetical protein
MDVGDGGRPDDCSQDPSAAQPDDDADRACHGARGRRCGVGEAPSFAVPWRLSRSALRSAASPSTGSAKRYKALLTAGAAWSLSMSVLMAVAVPCIARRCASTSPCCAEYVLEVADLDTSWFPGAIAACAYATVAAMAIHRSAVSAKTEPAPPMGAGAVKDLIVQSPWWIATFVHRSWCSRLAPSRLRESWLGDARSGEGGWGPRR